MYISIVGVDRVPLAYYRTKFAVERLVEESGLGWTTLRTTQFHDLLVTLCSSLGRLPVLAVPAGVADQPIEVAEVAERLVELALGAPAGRVPDLAGPEVHGLDSVARAWLRATGRRRPVVRVPLFGRAYRAFREGGHLAPDRALGKVTFDEYLARRFGADNKR